MAGPIRFSGSRQALSSGAAIQVRFKPGDIERVQKRFAQNMGAPLQRRLQIATLKAADLMRGPIAAAAPVGATGNLRRSVKARQERATISGRTTATFNALVGPVGDPVAHLVIGGTKPHSLATIRPGKSAYDVFKDGNVRRTSGALSSGSQPSLLTALIAGVLGTDSQSSAPVTHATHALFHPGAQANPFVSRVAGVLYPRVVAIVREEAFV